MYWLRPSNIRHSLRWDTVILWIPLKSLSCLIWEWLFRSIKLSAISISKKQKRFNNGKTYSFNRELTLINNLASCYSTYEPSITSKYWPSERATESEFPAEQWSSHRFKCQPPLAERVFEGWVLCNHRLRRKSQFQLRLIIVFDI